MQQRTKAGTSKASAADKHALFVEAYCSNGGNATQAAIAAGYSAKTAGMAGGRLIKDDRISSVIKARLAEVREAAQEATMISVSDVLREARAIVMSDLAECFDAKGKLLSIHDMPREARRAIAGFETDGAGVKKVKFWDKNSAIEKLMKHLGLFERDNRQLGDAFAERLVRARERAAKAA